jgi:hypothetical protein
LNIKEKFSYTKKKIEKMMRKIILEWLCTKYNYVSYRTNIDNQERFENKLAHMLWRGRVHFSNLHVSDCYIIQNISNKIEFNYESSTHYRHNYQNFNVKRNEYILDKVKMIEASQRFTVENSMQNQRIVIDLLNELKHSYISKNKFLEKFDKYTYKDIFVNINESSLEQNIKEIKTFLQENEFNFKDFKSDYIDKIKDETIGLKEVGIFYPFVLNHDIFKNSHFLFEINHLKFKRRTKHFFDIVENFYKKYEINHCLLKELFTLDDYFNYPDIEDIDCFAYFDPFKHLAKYELKYKPIRENILKYKLDFQNFIFELFDFFNKAQIEIVRFQHLNLVDALIAARTQDRRYSVEELIKLQIKRVENDELPLLQGDELKFYYFVLLALENQSPGFRFTKNTKIDDLQNFEEMTIQEKQIAQSILNDFLNVLNKDDSSKLQYIYNEYKNQINIMMKKYKLSPSNKKIIYDMLLDLIYFYNDKDNEKLSRPFNSTIAKIYQKNQNKDISKLIDINFKEKFKKQYRHYFDVYKPKSKLKEDVTTPHL